MGSTLAAGSHSDDQPWIWTNDLPDTEHVRFFKGTDWAATPLGPLEDWGFALKLHAHTIFADSRASCLYW